MPFKNRCCSKCRTRMRPHRWVRYVGTNRWGGERWEKEVKCPKCGAIEKDWQVRRKTQEKQTKRT